MGWVKLIDLHRVLCQVNPLMVQTILKSGWMRLDMNSWIPVVNPTRLPYCTQLIKKTDHGVGKGGRVKSCYYLPWHHKTSSWTAALHCWCEMHSSDDFELFPYGPPKWMTHWCTARIYDQSLQIPNNAWELHLFDLIKK